MNNTQKKFLIGFILLAIIGGVYLMNLARKSNSLSGAYLNDYDIPYLSLPKVNSNSSITDTREFMKMSYDGQLKTRKVKDTFRNVKSIISDNDGRIDDFYQNENDSYVSFVVPKDKFEILRTDIESLTHEKLYVESISSTNLLSQKQNIEQRQDGNNDTLDSLEEQTKVLNTQHASKVAKINKDLAAVKVQLAYERNSIVGVKDEALLTASKNQESVLYQKQIQLEEDLNTENNIFKNKQNIYKDKVNQVTSNLTALDKEDTNFVDNLETVNGYIGVKFVSLWELATIFSPIHPIILIAVFVVILFIYFKRRPKLKLV